MDYEEAKEFAEENGLHFFEISCKNNTGIDLFLKSLRKELTKFYNKE